MARPTIIVDNWDGTKVEVTLREFVSRWTNQVGDLYEIAIDDDDRKKATFIKDTVKEMAIAKFWQLNRKARNS
ncbi:MAG: hypothetical protein VXX56_07560 [Pseudomonadota bacterium]|nr:hypothetical protein [Pseudomonadota bacterium]MEC9228222.1 hypothetical protein [Verrucomicrobiota bacterium]|tara:strand:- start:257 stop:475 length:219 start_codon:yes stop_codon:yes gene_type:complete